MNSAVKSISLVGLTARYSLPHHFLGNPIYCHFEYSALSSFHVSGDLIIMELCDLPPDSNLALVRIWKNNLPIALRYIGVPNKHTLLYPTVSLLSHAATVTCDVIPPNMIEQLPSYFVSLVL